MADNTQIEWTEATWNPITGCSLASPGCTNCYAMQLAGTRLAHIPSRAGLTREVNGNHVWTGEVRFNEQWLDQPLRWKRPRMIFVCAHGDLFHESVPDEWIDKAFAVMALAPQHTFQVLTKRAGRMRDYLTTGRQFEIQPETYNLGLPELKRRSRMEPHVRRGTLLPLPNVWLGVSVEDQSRADERIPDLLATPAAVRWISAEPLLGPVNIIDAMWARDGFSSIHASIDWVVVGGESGSKARPMHPDWARNLRDQCHESGTPFFFKQWGEFAPGEIAGAFLDPEKPARGFTHFDNRWSECWSEVDGHRDDEPDVYCIGKKRAGRLLDGVEHNGMPGQ